jgi:hypothetical protein
MKVRSDYTNHYLIYSKLYETYLVVIFLKFSCNLNYYTTWAKLSEVNLRCCSYWFIFFFYNFTCMFLQVTWHNNQFSSLGIVIIAYIYGLWLWRSWQSVLLPKTHSANPHGALFKIFFFHLFLQSVRLIVWQKYQKSHKGFWKNPKT